MTEKTVEQSASEIGWRPLEEFKGDPEKWVDAQEYLRRGEEILPLVKAENRRLHERQDKLTAEITRLTAAIGEQRQSMDDMAKFNLEQLGQKLDEQKRSLTLQLRAARREEGAEATADLLEDELEANKEAREKLKEAKKPPAAAPAAPQQAQETPEFRAWAKANPWYGGNSRMDQAKTAAAHRFAAEAAQAGKQGEAFFAAVDEALAEVYPPTKLPTKAEDGRPSGGGGGGAPTGFAALPADAKAKAREQASRFVGANKMFKKEEDWFSYYAKQYNTEAA